ncbi:MAG: hypothetical protein IPL47_01870 [Phyllobacteriaceae bacterium]|nr:hypothetical protein [Phyllobacteriaceae bacterium]
MDLPEFAAHRLRAALVGLNFILTGRRFAALAAKANFNPGQPRVPRGNADGGRWTKVPGGLPVVRVQAGPRNPGRGRGGPIRPGARLENPSPAQLARLEASRLAMNRALGQVREVDPRWKPTPQIYETVEGEIAAADAVRREAEAWLRELARRGFGPGPNAVDWLPARGPGRDFRKSERDEINRIGRKYGCHTCGTKNPGTPSGNFVIDHQLPARWALEPYRLYPQCALCSWRQGGYVRSMLRREE